MEIEHFLSNDRWISFKSGLKFENVLFFTFSENIIYPPELCPKEKDLKHKQEHEYITMFRWFTISSRNRLSMLGISDRCLGIFRIYSNHMNTRKRYEVLSFPWSDLVWSYFDVARKWSNSMLNLLDVMILFSIWTRGRTNCWLTYVMQE